MHTNESAATSRTRTRSASPQPTAAAPSADSIRLRAYQFYLERGGAPGDPLADWLRAERELIAKAPARRRTTSSLSSTRKRA